MYKNIIKSFIVLFFLTGEFAFSQDLQLEDDSQNSVDHDATNRSDNSITEPPIKPKAYIKVIKGVGKGCYGLDTKFDDIEQDYSEFTYEFYSFEVEYEQSLSPRDRRSICQFTIEVDTPEGWQFSPQIFHISGYAVLEGKSTLNIQTKYKFQGQAEEEIVNRISAPNDLYFSFANFVGPNQRKWSDCGKSNNSLIIKISALLNKPEGSYGYAKIHDFTTNHPSQDYYGSLKWRKCKTDTN